MDMKVCKRRKTTKVPPPAELLDELVTEILLRLPVKSLLRFKSVSKAWRATISDPFFVHSHLRQSASRCRQNPSLLVTPHTLEHPRPSAPSPPLAPPLSDSNLETESVSSRDEKAAGRDATPPTFFLHRRPEQGPIECIASKSLSSPGFPPSSGGCLKICSAQITVPPATRTVGDVGICERREGSFSSGEQWVPASAAERGRPLALRREAREVANAKGGRLPTCRREDVSSTWRPAGARRATAVVVRGAGGPPARAEGGCPPA
ncbi:hypothetical protein QYE76_048452 [Lolium multiflorum]|uniref:F-box domain-containing protein n=1 Tax=Lolium multiflorum TaxID=4521 RepID=A0AAD8WHB6_LOLMU|nr:hypothetical protein QYE76_048452 [Lolium multiflorum]